MQQQKLEVKQPLAAHGLTIKPVKIRLPTIFNCGERRRLLSYERCYHFGRLTIHGNQAILYGVFPASKWGRNPPLRPCRD